MVIHIILVPDRHNEEESLGYLFQNPFLEQHNFDHLFAIAKKYAVTIKNEIICRFVKMALQIN